MYGKKVAVCEMEYKAKAVWSLVKLISGFCAKFYPNITEIKLK